MGLDSIELVMEVEKHFKISITDPEAEKIYTVQAMVDIVASHLNITDKGAELRDKIFDNVNEALLKLHVTATPISLTDKVSKYLSPEIPETWQLFKKELQLDVPNPEIVKGSSFKIIDKIKYAFNWAPLYDWSCITIDQFVAAICACNHEALINKERVTSLYEIYIAVIAITVNKTGVDYYEISPEKSFTNDLGVD